MILSHPRDEQQLACGRIMGGKNGSVKTRITTARKSKPCAGKDRSKEKTTGGSSNHEGLQARDQGGNLC